MTVLGLLKSALDPLDLQLEALLAATGEVHAQVLAEQLCEGWHSLAGQLAEADSPALMDLMALYAENLDLLFANSEGALSAPEQALLRRWHDACRLHLQAPTDKTAIIAWVSLLQSALWQVRLGDEDVAELSDGLHESASLGGLGVEDEIELQTDDEPFIEPLADRPVAPVDIALVQMISHEFDQVANDLTHTLAKFNCASLAEYQESLGANDFLLENINKACEIVGLFGLSYVFRRLWLNVVTKPRDDHNYDEECNLFGIALILIQEYLNDIADKRHSSVLVRHLHEPGWRRPLPEALQTGLFAALNVPVTDPDVQRAHLERTLAKPEDVSLLIPSDVDGELVQALLHELPLLTENFSVAIQEIIGAHGSQARLLEAQRIAHTIKGACNTIGVHGIASLTHSLEAILEAFNLEQALPGRELGAVLVDAADCLEAMSDCLQGQGAAPEQALAILQQLLDWDYRIKKEGVAGVEGVADATEMMLPVATGSVAQEDNRAKAMTTLPTLMLDQITEAAAEAGSIGERLHDKIGGLLNDSGEVREMSWRLSELVAEMDRLVNIKSVTARDSRSNQGFDTLELEQYGDMHTCLSRLAEVAADVREQNAQMQRQLLNGKNLLIEQRTLQKSQLDRVQQLRLAPVQRIVARCQRIVRQTARITAKEVELQISGENTLIDSETLNGLADALMHLLRNAVDHGIEAPESRQQAGKPRQGTIRLNFVNDRNVLTISCEDDGSGLDTARILAAGRDRGLVADQQRLSEEQIQRLIFHPGFSTREQASQVSGRGIGMDAIQAQISRMNGVVDLASRPGEGLTVTMNIPSNQYDAAMILVKVEDQTFAVSEHCVEQIFCSLDGTLVTNDGDELQYQVEQHHYAAGTLASLLGVAQKEEMSGQAAGLLFKSRNGIEQVVLVDQVIGYKNLMIRPFGDYLKGVYGVLGGVMLGSGQIAPAIDLFELLADAERGTRSGHATSLAPVRPRLAKTVALVVDDSLSARKATMQLLMDAGYEVQTAIDGLDAIEKIEAHRPDIILSDLEMPRMNGIELTRYLRAAPELRAIPVIMITSRSTEKHRAQADSAGVTLYLTKPFSDDDLIIKLNSLLQDVVTEAA